MSEVIKFPDKSENRLRSILKQLKDLEDDLAEVIDTYEENGCEEELLDALTEALDALEDAKETIDEAMR